MSAFPCYVLYQMPETGSLVPMTPVLYLQNHIFLNYVSFTDKVLF